VKAEEDRLFYDITGKGRPLVLIHGVWASHEWWRWLVPALARNYYLITPDVRGHGQSSPLKSAYTVNGFAKDLDLLLQSVGIHEVVLVGWSMGGMISLEYGLNYPSKVKALILIATRGHRNPKVKRRIILQYLQARLSLLMDFTAPRKYDRVSEGFPRQKMWLKREVEKMLSPEAPEEVKDWVMSHVTNHPREEYFQAIRSIWNWGADKKLKNIKAPTLIMVGDKDTRTPPPFSHLLHASIPNSRLVIVEEAGHCLPMERPERVNREIMGFLKGLGY
jgi:pimeloyl-ACP methyl ester carboxylesterase